MSITRRDTIIIATLCNVLVLISIIATARVVKSPEKQQERREKSISIEASHSLDRAVAARPIEESRKAHTSLPDEALLLFQVKDQESASLPEESHSFDEIDQLLEEYEKPIPAVKKNDSVSKKESVLASSSGEKKKSIKEMNSSSLSQERKAPPVALQSNSPPKANSSKKRIQSSVVGSNRRVYVVQSGDNPWTIAKKCKIPVETLLSLNKLDEVKAKNLKIGQVLIIEGASIGAEEKEEDDDLNSKKTQEKRFKATAR